MSVNALTGWKIWLGKKIRVSWFHKEVYINVFVMKHRGSSPFFGETMKKLGKK